MCVEIINWNSSLISSLVGVVVGSLLTILINLLTNYITDRRSRVRALQILSAEFEKIKRSVPGLLNSYNNHFELIINAQMISPPFGSGSFDTVNRDLLSLDKKTYKNLFQFYSLVENFHNEYVELLSAKELTEKNVYGLMVKESLTKINADLERVESILRSY